ncbi:DUF6504 family protein [Pseudokineococcus sp. 5B2Z-1]|uniref:DUF6504 family protein n=1 Tax=Pseudokineococcus sp. 5B2Z-1 TaxID=3132744 RepID=UPI0030B43EB4
MARTYDDEVDVRTAPRAGASEGEPADGAAAEQPAAFVWHGRLHVVRAVLGRWYERRAWWEQDPQRAEEAPVLVAAGSAAPRAARAVRAPSLDREVWQVEASAGRAAGSGVYELCREDPAVPGGWTLRRVDD